MPTTTPTTIETAAERLVDRLLSPHPSEEVVAYVPIPSATCGETHDVTCGSGMWDIGTCYRPADHDDDHDYQVEPPTVIRPWHLGDAHFCERTDGSHEELCERRLGGDR